MTVERGLFFEALIDARCIVPKVPKVPKGALLRRVTFGGQANNTTVVVSKAVVSAVVMRRECGVILSVVECDSGGGQSGGLRSIMYAKISTCAYENKR